MELIENVFAIARAILIFLLFSALTACSISTVKDSRDPRYAVESYVFGWGTIPKAGESNERSQDGEKRSTARAAWLK